MAEDKPSRNEGKDGKELGAKPLDYAKLPELSKARQKKLEASKVFLESRLTHINKILEANASKEE